MLYTKNFRLGYINFYNVTAYERKPDSHISN